ncbi:hypothetical protein IGL98_002608 [Enterococcus sp. DIV0840]|uniref:hypothetical protein n=1 Tax=Enterococcus TaxID=1350 RepID=UPI001A8F56A6|nr:MULTISPECIES: hypothetical protein [Enterococcus]MBO0434282.1 hypothetical protein [Enterococcus sp. DIV0849a]MBO0473591.1 hypothetical protein [Enterococcus ureasiticus]
MKKIISGLLVVVFVGGLGFVTVSEAVKSPNFDQMNRFEMGHRRRQDTRNDKKIELERKLNTEELTKKEGNEIQKKQEESNDYTYSRRENHRGNHMGGVRQSRHGRMNNSCWQNGEKAE